MVLAPTALFGTSTPFAKLLPGGIAMFVNQ
jgi:hypothetical protein